MQSEKGGRGGVLSHLSEFVIDFLSNSSGAEGQLSTEQLQAGKSP